MNSINKNKAAAWFAIAVLFLIADRLLKSLASAGFWREPFSLVGDLFSLNFFKNYYIAFSISWIKDPFLSLLILFIIIGLIYCLIYLYKKNSPVEEMGLLLFLTLGAISNFFDRVKWGYVIDYFDLKYFTVFNIADIMIVLGAGGLIWLRVIKNTK